uniref:Uncharacterized protein n=1 Tax=Mycena chlorophos TaxID=658473 RepID=A0ABQ0LFP3_MYCCL|nr:predicted protein [Mycena chlorophos]
MAPKLLVSPGSAAQIYSSLIFSALSFIPHPILRVLSIAFCVLLICGEALVSRRPAIMLAELSAIIEDTEDMITGVGRRVGPVAVMRENIALIRIKYLASIFRCSILAPDSLSWREYVKLWRAISKTTTEAEKVLSRVRLVTEADLRRSYAASMSASTAPTYPSLPGA